MTTLEQFVSPALTRALGWTLLHSLWQGALVAAVLAGALLLLRRQRAEVRYAASAGALGVVVALAGLTFGLYSNSSPDVSVGPVPAAPSAPLAISPTPAMPGGAAAKASADAAASRSPHGLPPPTAAARPVATAAASPLIRSVAQSLIHSLNDHLPLLVLAWLLGLLAMSLRMLGGLLYVQRLRRYRVRPLSAGWQQRLAALAARSGVRRPVQLLESALVRVPLVVGHVRPVILLPLGTVAGLPPAYLEAILAHELAHVLRRDYLVNLLQTVAEVLFFYHPAVWFVAACVRTERENCCDDTATALVGGDPLRLARALTALAEWSQSAAVPAAPRLALAALNRPGALLLRVRRLVQRRPAAPTLAEGLLAGALVLGGLGLLGGSVALAGPLAGSGQAVKPVAFGGQTSPPPPAKAAGAADTNKRAARVAPAPPAAPAAPVAPETAVVPAPPVEEGREIVVERAAAGDGKRSDDDRPGPRRTRRVVVNGRETTPPPFPGDPGTVVITKDKKGRLTDLVVNGQHVETAVGKGKKGQGQQVEVVQVAPFDGADARSFAFRTDEALDPLVRGEVERTIQRNVERNVRRTIERNLQRNGGFQFDFSDFGDQFNKSFRVAPGGALNRTYRLKSLANGGADPESRRATLDALRGAEHGLRTAAAAKGLNAEQRKEIAKELEKVRAQLNKAERAPITGQPQRPHGRQDVGADLREQERDMREREQEMRERQRDMLEQQQEFQERIRESREELRDKEQDRGQVDRSRERREALIDQLQRDGLIQDKQNFQLRLTPKVLIVNGKEQPAAVRDKYLKLQAEAAGKPMTGNNAMVITRNGDSSTSFDGSEGPRPPRPPRAPQAPMMAPPAPPMGVLPAPPAPPFPPRVDASALRGELRKDGIIGADEQNLQFQLNGAGLTVNGKKQSDELAAKYRKTTGHTDGKSFNVMISTQEN